MKENSGIPNKRLDNGNSKYNTFISNNGNMQFTDKKQKKDELIQNNFRQNFKNSKHKISFKSRNIYRQQKLMQNKEVLLTELERQRRKKRLRDNKFLKRPLFLKGFVKKTSLLKKNNTSPEFFRAESQFLPFNADLSKMKLPYSNDDDSCISVPNEYEEIFLWKELKYHYAIRYCKQISNDTWSFNQEKRCYLVKDLQDLKNLRYLLKPLGEMENDEKSIELKNKITLLLDELEKNKVLNKESMEYPAAIFEQKNLESTIKNNAKYFYDTPKLLTEYKYDDTSDPIYFKKIDPQLAKKIKSLPNFSIIEANYHYKDLERDKVEDLFRSDWSFEGKFKTIKFEYNTSLKKLVNLKQINLNSNNGGFDLFECIKTNDWMNVYKKLISMRLNPKIDSLALENKEQQLITQDDILNKQYLVKGNFIIYSEILINTNGMFRKLIFTFVQEKFQ